MEDRLERLESLLLRVSLRSILVIRVHLHSDVSHIFLESLPLSAYYNVVTRHQNIMSLLLMLIPSLYSQLRPDTDFTEELGPPIIRDSWKSAEDRRSSTFSRNSSSLPHSESSSNLRAYPVSKGSPFTHPRVPPPFIHRNTRKKPARILNEDGEESTSTISDSSSDGGSSTDDECERLQSLIQYPSQATEQSISAAAAVRYHGKSSQSSLVKVTRQFKELRLLEMTSSKETPWRPLFRPEFWSAPPVSACESHIIGH
jgi:hypothetical protein